jgi:WD40-like Beta Propeller Repeat
VRFVGLIAALLVAAACGSSTAPHGTPSGPITFALGNQQTDTIQATLNQALVVKVTAPAGQSSASQVVQFVAIPDTSQSQYEAFPEVLTSNQPSLFVADTTNNAGEASVDVVLGSQAGRARLIVKVPAFGFVDTATFTVTAGNADSLRAGPADTAAYINGKVSMHATVTDRFGNPRTDPVTFKILSGPATLSGSTVTVTNYGRILVSGQAGAVTDTTYISGVPTGTIAGALDAGGIAVFNLDGSGYKTITSTAAGNVVWAPNGQSLAFDQTCCGGDEGGTTTLFGVTLSNGTVSTLDNSPSSIDAWPTYSRDGLWIYYVTIFGGTTLKRVHPDGSSNGAVTMVASPGVQFPSPSPDGQSIAYIVPGVGTLEVLTMSSGVSAPVGSIAGESAAWSPTSDLIAVRTGSGSIIVVHSDGTGQITVAPGPYDDQMGWSPDGKWITSRNQATRRVDLISVTSNLVLPVGFSGTVASPAWH